MNMNVSNGKEGEAYSGQNNMMTSKVPNNI